MADWKRICCGVDFSDISRLAMDQACYLARLFEADLFLVHVHEAPRTTEETRGAAAKALRDAETALDSLRTQAEFLACRPVTSVLLEGSPARELLRFARERDCDFVVVGTLGRTGLEHVMLGSVAARVVREAHCPVLVMRHAKTTR